MTSGWLVELMDGSKQIMTEQVYEEYTMGRHPIMTEGRNHKHFFDIEDAIKNNPDTDVLWK